MLRRLAGPGTRRPLAAGVVLLALAIAACGGDGDDADTSAVDFSAQSVAEATQDLPFQPAVLNGNLGVGETRLSIALLLENGAPAGGAEVTARLFRLGDDPETREATLVSEIVLTPRTMVTGAPHLHGDGSVHDHSGFSATTYVANTSFDATGFWGAALDVDLEGETHEAVLLTFFVSERTSEPGVGEAVPASVQRVAHDVDDIAEIDSSLPPNPELHQITVADAISNGRPTLVAFVTPSFCQTQLCGPVMETVILPVHEIYGDRVDVLHIEPFDLARLRAGEGLESTAVTAEWKLLSEPALFVLDAEGIVSAKFEGIMDLEEVSRAIEEVLQGG